MPDLAEHWDVADEGRTYRFALRAGVTMHDGAELTADDVKRSAERALHPSTPDPNASYFANIAGYEAYAAGKAEHLAGVVVEGRYVVAFHLAKPDSTFPYLLAMHTLRPTCRSAGDRYSDTWQRLRRRALRASPRTDGGAGRACAWCVTRATSAPESPTSTRWSGRST